MRRWYDIRYNDSGVSESIGFLLVFSIIIAGIGLVTLYGYPLLLQQQVSADEKIMEKNMIVLQNDIKSLAYKTVPYKETSLKIGGGSLTVYNSSLSPSKFDITYPGYTNSFKSGELRYESVSSQTDLSLQNGGVAVRPRNQQGSSMLADPRWFYDPLTKTMVINLINITSDGLMAKEGIGTVRMKLGDTKYNQYNSPNSNLIINYTSTSDQDYSVAWKNYFTKMGMTSGATGYTLPNVDWLIVKEYEVKIEAI
jgi:hypothetical protein